MSRLDELTFAAARGAAKKYTDSAIAGVSGGFFVVTTTKEDSGYVADKTNAEIHAAHQAGKRVILHMGYEDQWYLATEVTATKAKFGFVEDDGQDGVNASVVVMETTGGVMSIDANLWGIATDTDLANYRTASAQNAIDATKQDALTAGSGISIADGVISAALATQGDAMFSFDTDTAGNLYVNMTDAAAEEFDFSIDSSGNLIMEYEEA